MYVLDLFAEWLERSRVMEAKQSKYVSPCNICLIYIHVSNPVTEGKNQFKKHLFSTFFCKNMIFHFLIM